MKVYVNNNCRFVKGFKNAAIYDFNRNKVYAVNSVGSQIIDKALNDNKLSASELDYITKLAELNLLTEQESNDVDYIPKNKITFAWLEITEKCNLKCVHCYGEFGEPNIKCEDVLSVEEWKNVIDELVKFGCNSIQFIGGEPTISPYLRELLKYSNVAGIKKLTIFTNATLLKESDMSILKNLGVNIRVSLYGHNSQVHDAITGKSGSFELTQKNLMLLKKSNIPASISVIIMKENEKYISEIKEYIANIGYKFLGYDVIRATSFENRYSHSIKDYDILKERYLCSAEFYTNRKQYMINKYMNPCWNSKIAITSTGDILPCVFAREEKIGNVRHNGLKCSVVNNQYLNLTKDMIVGCKDCEYRYACHDCRPLAKGLGNSLNSKNPRCSYNPYIGVWEDIKTSTLEIVSRDIAGLG